MTNTKETLETARAKFGVPTVAGCHGCETQLVCPTHDPKGKPPCASWCGANRDYNELPKSKASYLFFPGRSLTGARMAYCSEACRDAGSPLNQPSEFLRDVPVGSVVRRVHPAYPRLFRVKASKGDWVTCETIKKDGTRDERFNVGWSGSLRRSQWEIVSLPTEVR